MRIHKESMGKKQDKQKSACVFCDSSDDITKEHVIPKWLQNYFGLYNQRVRLWNETTMPYRQAIIPICHNCNSNRFGLLENAVQNMTASEQQFYIWALKIRYGMAIRDSLLSFDQKNPNKGSLLPNEIATFGADFIKPVLRNFDKPDFTFQPNPFGSVFIFTKNSVSFDFIDIPQPYRAVGIVLPENRVLVVLLADRGVVKKVAINMGISKYIDHHIDTFNLRTIMFTLLRLQNRMRIPRGVEVMQTGVRCEPIPRILQVRQQKSSWYLEIANYCGLDDKIAIEAFKADAIMDKMKYVLVT